MRMCSLLATERRGAHAAVMAAAKAAAAADQRRQAFRQIVDVESERIYELAGSTTIVMPSFAATVAEAYRS